MALKTKRRLGGDIQEIPLGSMNDIYCPTAPFHLSMTFQNYQIDIAVHYFIHFYISFSLRSW